MRKFLLRISVCLVVTLSSVFTIHAQDTSTSVDPKILDITESRIPKEYTIANVGITGIHHLDTSIVLSISGLQIGDKVMIPGSDVFSKSIQNLWRQKLFSNVQIYITKMEGDKIWLE